MNFRKIYECGLTYEKGNDGPFEEWKTSIEKAKEIKPEIKGTPHFDYEVAPESQNNKPSCPYTYDTYEAEYSKTGSLTESLDWDDDDWDELVDQENDYNFDPENLPEDEELFDIEEEEELPPNFEDWDSPDEVDFDNYVKEVPADPDIFNLDSGDSFGKDDMEF
jgi:hypothetical protein